MNFFRRLKKRTMITWSILLSLSLIVAQGVTLHVHSVDHDYYGHYQQDHADNSHSEHSHVSKAHFSHDASHGDYHEEIFSEVDVSPSGLLKASFTQILSFVLITFIVLLALPMLVGQVLGHRRDSNVLHYQCYLISPPLRAPPL